MQPVILLGIKLVIKTSSSNNLKTNEEILQEHYISPELRQKNIDDLRLMQDSHNNLMI